MVVWNVAMLWNVLYFVSQCLLHSAIPIICRLLWYTFQCLHFSGYNDLIKKPTETHTHTHAHTHTHTRTHTHTHTHTQTHTQTHTHNYMYLGWLSAFWVVNIATSVHGVYGLCVYAAEANIHVITTYFSPQAFNWSASSETGSSSSRKRTASSSFGHSSC